MVFISKVNNYMFRPKAAIFRLSQLQFCSKSGIYKGKSKSKVPHFIATKQPHILRCLFVHLLHNTSLIFPHSHLVCWGTCLGGKSISQNPVDRRWDPDQAAMFAPHAWHRHVIWIAWHKDVFSCWGGKMKIQRCQIRAIGRVLKNFPAPNNRSHLCLCPHTQCSTRCTTASSTEIAELELRKCFRLATNVRTYSVKRSRLAMWSYLVEIKLGTLLSDLPSCVDLPL